MRKFCSTVALVFSLGVMTNAALSNELVTGQELPVELRILGATYDVWGSTAGQKRFKAKKLWSNVSADDITKLLAGKTSLFYVEDGTNPKLYGALRVDFYGMGGETIGCVLNYADGKSFRIESWEWHSATVTDKALRLQYPLYSVKNADGSVGYASLQYNAGTGQLAMPVADGRYWWDLRKGHLQEGIPAAVYEICPEFPSAKSLGTFVNKKQTAWNYFDLVKQDPGKRVKRPDLVSEYTPRYFNPWEKK